WEQHRAPEGPLEAARPGRGAIVGDARGVPEEAELDAAEIVDVYLFARRPGGDRALDALHAGGAWRRGRPEGDGPVSHEEQPVVVGARARCVRSRAFVAVLDLDDQVGPVHALVGAALEAEDTAWRHAQAVARGAGVGLEAAMLIE